MSLLDRAIIGVLPLVPKPVVGFFSKRYIAGDTVEKGLAESQRLNEAGCVVTLDVLGEDIRSRDEALGARDAYLRLLGAIDEAGIEGNVSLKPTQLGLELDLDFATETIRAVVARAHELGSFVRIDMEDATTTDHTLEVYRRLRSEFSNLGVVLQSCLRRTVRDAEALAAQQANVRLCKGIYIEPYRISWRDPEIIRRAFVRDLEVLLRGGSYVGIATHDEILVYEALELVRRLNLPPDAYEFQMLLGVTERLRQIVIDGGHRMRVYVPFGREWYAYSTRRLRENPKMASTILRDILGLSQERRRR